MLCTLLLAGFAAPTRAQDYSHSILSSHYIDVEGSTNGQPDNCSDGKCGEFTVAVRDFANNPVAGVTVSIDFSLCPDIQISCDQLFAVTGQTNVGGKVVSGTANAAGQFVFRIQGAANATPTSTNTTSDGTNAGVACAHIYVDSVPLTLLQVCAYDLNGMGSPSAAVSSADVSLIVADVVKGALGAQARERDDLNHSGTVTVADAAMMAAMVARVPLGTGSQTTGPFCP
jgi:hypothetical protein